jgi:hypothetical protein
LGADQNRLCFLYTAAVYYYFNIWLLCLVFSAEKKAIVKQVRSFQRTVCLLLTRAFKTTATASLLILVNLMPIALCEVGLAALLLSIQDFSQIYLSDVIPESRLSNLEIRPMGRFLY